jgi:copper chaperone
MNETTLKVDGMSCEHCVKAVTQAVSDVAGTSNVKVDLKAGTASFNHSGSDDLVAKVKTAIDEAGFEVL